MATSTELTTKVQSGSPYQLDDAQTLKASKALLSFMHKSKKTTDEKAGKRSLITEEDEEEEGDDSAVWLLLTTKKHIVDQKKLKPSKILLPNPFPIVENMRICLIVASPQRTYKDLVASPAFPEELRNRIGRVIEVNKLEKKYKEYEKLRQLRDEYDMFIADDRIVTRLPKTLGKTFFQTTAKRPIPIDMQATAPRTDGKKVKAAKGSEKAVIEPKQLAARIEQVFKCTLVSLSPSTLTSVRVGRSSMTPEALDANVRFVAHELINRFVPKKWKNVRSFHIKGPETASLPIWLADELWVEETDVVEESTSTKAIKGDKSNIGKKRKALEAPVEEPKKEKKVKTVAKPESNDNTLDNEIALRKEKLKKQKAAAAASVADDISIPEGTTAKSEGKMKKKKNRSVSA